jgi:hypothetical protein
MESPLACGGTTNDIFAPETLAPTASNRNGLGADLDTPGGKADTPAAFSVARLVTIFEILSGYFDHAATLGNRFVT